MQVNIKGLISRLDDLRERLNKLFDKFDDLEQEEIAIEDVEQYFQNDDTFNLSIALDILEQADKLDKALEIIKEKMVNVCAFISWNNVVDFTYAKYLDLEYTYLISAKRLTEAEFNLLKEVLL